MQILSFQLTVATTLTGKFKRFLHGFGHHVIHGSFSIEIGRNAMSPPELSGDAPVLHILHPVTIGILELGGLKLHIIVHNMLQRRCSQVLHLQEPLQTQLGFDYRIGSLRKAHLIHIVLCLNQVSCFLKHGNNQLPCFKSILTHQYPGRLIQSAVVIKNIDGLQVVF